MSSNFEEVAQMDAQSSDISTSFASHPEDGKTGFWVEITELCVFDGSDSELSLDT